MAQTFLVMKCEVLRVQKTAAVKLLLFLIVKPWLDRIRVCECENRCVWKGLFVDCFITSWAGLRSVVGVTCLMRKSTTEQWGQFGNHATNTRWPTRMAAGSNPVTSMGRLPVFVWTDSGVNSEDTSQKDIQQNYVSACTLVTYSICYLWILIMFRLFFSPCWCFNIYVALL